jgi:peptidylprolyl isomerase
LRAVKGLALILSLCMALAIAGCGGDDDSSTESTATTPSAAGGKPIVELPKGAPPRKLVIEDLKTGTGAVAKPGDQVTVQYVGVDYKTGKQFDASWDRHQPFPFQLGAGQVIPGWDKGVAGMRVGGRRELVIPPNLAYGPQGQPPVIGPNATLVFVVDLVAVS